MIINEKDRRFTLPATMAALRKACPWTPQGFHIDVAAEPGRNLAPAWFGPLGGPEHDGWKGPDGLAVPWFGDVWCNPPWSQKEAWIKKAWAEFRELRANSITMVLPSNCTDQPWWQELVEPEREGRGVSPVLSTYFLPGRKVYGTPEDPTGEHFKGSFWYGTVALVWR